ncbi:UDP-N-acetylglucosamine 2-epimerase (non-hydrolyzing) [Janthinobacterium sp. CG_23.3]|uniref:non-hydrolyzing UDP-N-acetylglucosamine 2-epimerase n=1 Tax=Janthinobacterium sp. CG_23.3 TaxID=3349634 RepID=UPI0038D3762D
MSHRTPIPPHIVCVIAARPNLMKMAPILAALRELQPAPRLTLVHTGQHYDNALNEQHFAALGMAAPDLNLDVGSGSHAAQTAEVMRRFEPVLERDRPSAVLVVGDVNSTLACALVAAKRGVPVLHVEAGLRSFDRSMPEEINRLLTDQLSELLFTSEAGARDNLLREGIAAERIHFAGNVMIDTLQRQLPHAVPLAETLRRYRCQPNAGAHAVLTLHRPANVDQRSRLSGLLHTASTLGARVPVLFPLHPRTRARLDQFGLKDMLDPARVVLLPPLGYLEMLGLMRDARLVLTDSGGIQEETTALGVPCLTLRANTERPITVSEGSNTIAGHEPAVILALCEAILAGGGKRGRVPRYWDGHAAERIAATVGQWLAAPAPRAEPVLAEQE